MVQPVNVRRDEFVAQLSSAQLSVSQLTADNRMLNVDVASADLDQDGTITGRAEVEALFDRVDRLDQDGSSASLMLAGRNGPTATAAPLAAIGDLGNAPYLQSLANEALPGISQGSARNARTGVLGGGTGAPPGPFGPGGPFGGPSAQQTARRLQVQTIRNTIGGELRRDPPDFPRVFSEMGKLTKDEAADFVRTLRLQHPDLYQKLGHEAQNDPDTRATVLSDEPAYSQRIIEGEARRLADAPDVGPNHTVEVMRSIPRAERAEVLREIERTQPKELRWLRQICRDTGDPAMREAFQRAHLSL